MIVRMNRLQKRDNGTIFCNSLLNWRFFCLSFAFYPYPLPSYNNLQHQLCAKKGDCQQDKAGESQSDRLATTPAPLPPSPEESGKDQPGAYGKKCLVGEVLGEQVVDVESTAEEAEGQQDEGEGDQLEQ